jgi:hypothetical protein
MFSTTKSSGSCVSPQIPSSKSLPAKQVSLQGENGFHDSKKPNSNQ